ncbi:uncharacterized protein A4U43_C09F380 [Asparagus officinalis]|uniref:AB hydrolase-1 domain-containing protein n=1 Tax=Asparagus officinalis TaxID=4686 RepID=A0A5P1E467_ASPOF|nr:uncharacterized protein LOC109823624 [Asparagus officinalis]ONK57424.1 uncharacterized protein A4U43_C09F380 [Asparagus officinalis]
MAAAGRKVSAASARSHTRNKMSKRPSSSSSPAILKNLSAILLVGLAAWTYRSIQPPPPKICGSPEGPPVTASRIKLKDGRHLAYLESGVPKEKANYKIIYVHGFYSCRHDTLPISQQVLEELGIYLVSFDRAGYGESDPDEKKTEKSTPLDIEELADQLGFGSKFYVIGFSMGGEVIWGCLKYIPHRLAGAALLAPVANVSKAAWDEQLLPDQWAVRVAHHLPWLTYWWNTQKWFPASSVIAVRPELFSPGDLKVLSKFISRPHYQDQILQQGEYNSLHRDMMVGFGHWEFDPTDLENPFPNGEGSVHLWHGAEDRIVSVITSRYLSQKLPWVRYHELQDAGHMFPLADGMADSMVQSLLLGDDK